MALYLIHFDRKLFHTQHYLGFCEGNDPSNRWAVHLQPSSRSGAKIIKSAMANGIPFSLVCIIRDADRYFERRIKKLRNVPTWCPECKRFEKRRPVMLGPQRAPIIYPAHRSPFRWEPQQQREAA